MSDLKPCPMCGDSTVQHMALEKVFEDNRYCLRSRIYCPTCGLNIFRYRGRGMYNGSCIESVEAAWNTRATDKRIAELEEALDDIRIRCAAHPYNVDPQAQALHIVIEKMAETALKG